ncbi:MAG: Bis(5-nucleosyl)-tetraphosphatase, symmetrical [Planctomycetota bacterium]|jgi:serine/threonine protein phosphatase 1
MPSVPHQIDGPVAVIGDVHGQTEKLRQIIGQLARLPDVQRRWIVFIGDLVDRGPDPAGTVQVFFDLVKQHGRVTWVCGNHELAMMGSLKLLPSPEYIDYASRWVHNYDTRSTFESWGAPFGDLDALKQAIPEQQRAVMADLPWAVEHPEFLFVHAGMDRNLPFETQIRILRQRDYSLTHPPWLYSKDFILLGAPMDAPVPLVIGHVPVPRVQSALGMIMTDTGAGSDGELSCVLLPEGTVLQSQPEIRQRGFSMDGPAPPPPPRRPQVNKPWWKVW